MPTQAKPRMLIVDDNEDMLTFLVTTFMDQYEVTAARNGSEAIELLRESLIVKDGQTPTTTYSIVISDWMMDKMDGPELCSRLRQNPATKDLPFILLTAKTDSQSKVQAMEVGVDAFIEKPFAVKYLEACIRNLLSRRDQG
jgi:DNA-binding response OmpR family regulator